ncbi:putative short-subunit dehydrogenase-like oxidoreductase (DUF2520 family) [Antricoccus suffuscus]|uniref:Putative short-subunit dehydrogenase-like oxidoreductase (DUF2520 family) n=1 Tax=Antricoccus suffuscus TaxID=1629062 RepID=A0A2T1A0U4_9ACTN|nr:Rossmann-like and DUF2520 domain-containing protein [Antricoccus suffuscus]PRZ42223.1 putative short-subunit dehydrogenase-like oxidoreductase (DUF2520 family) [Antricoccus suffuscus]
MPSRESVDIAVPQSIAVVGGGRLGTVLTRALRDGGVRVAGPFGRDAVIGTPDAVVLCVPDDQIAVVAPAYAGIVPLIGHTSGATPLSVIDAPGCAVFGIHPLQTFIGDDGPERFYGVSCAIGGTTPTALDFARRLAGMLHMHPFEINDEDRPAYHAAACVASNFLITLQDAAERIARGAAIDAPTAHEMLVPLVRAAVQNWAARGPRAALTGPVSRGDHATVARQRAAIGRVAPELLTLFDVFVERTQALSEQPAPSE